MKSLINNTPVILLEVGCLCNSASLSKSSLDAYGGGGPSFGGEATT